MDSSRIAIEPSFGAFVLETACPSCLAAAPDGRDFSLHPSPLHALCEAFHGKPDKKPYCCLLQAIICLDHDASWSNDISFAVLVDSYADFVRAYKDRPTRSIASSSQGGSRPKKFSIVQSQSPLSTALDTAIDSKTRLLDSSRADYTWIRSCLEDCQKNHTSCRQEAKTPTNNFAILLIDVHSWSLIACSTDVEYFTLSYVWGQSKTFQTTTQKLDELKQPGALDRVAHLIPRTIIDAFELVHQIGGKYLWTDVLCIVQDDGPTKRTQISQMATIYASACLTIIAATGEDADAGLPGVSPRTVGSEWLEIAGGVYLVPRHYGLSPVIENTKYFRRAWTYQEQILSKRRMYITNDGVYVQCRSEIRREDMEEPCRFGMDAVRLDPLAFLQSHSSMAKSGNWDKVFRYYGRFIRDYTGRELSFHSDTVNAVAGILDKLSSALSLSFREGLPVQLIDQALLWMGSGDLKRGDLNFPSWSWAGWEGAVHYALATGRDLHSMMGAVHFHAGIGTRVLYLTPERVDKIPWRENAVSSVDANASMLSAEAFTTASRSADRTILEIGARVIEAERFKFNSVPDKEWFSQAADGHFNHRGTDRRVIVSCYDILGPAGKACGRLYGETLPNDLGDGNHLLVALSKNGRHEINTRVAHPTIHWDSLNILLVRKTGEHWERVTIGQMDLLSWESSYPSSRTLMLQ